MTQTQASKITKKMFSAIVVPLIKRFTEETLTSNPKSSDVYFSTSPEQGGCPKPIDNTQDIAQQLVDNHLINHGAIRSIYLASSSNIALQGMKPFMERWQALGFVQHNPKSDVYNFVNRAVEGIHIELRHDLIKDFGINSGNDHDPRYFRWFLSQQDVSQIDQNLQNDIIRLLESGTDPMSKQELALLEQVKQGQDLNEQEIQQLVQGMYDFMSKPYIEVPTNLAEKWSKILANSSQKDSTYQKAEYFYSGLHSKINHVAFESDNPRSLHQKMQDAGLSLTSMQGSYPLEQFGSNVRNVKDKWAEYFKAYVLKDQTGSLLDHSGKPSQHEHKSRTFSFKNADQLFPAGTPDSLKS